MPRLVFCSICFHRSSQLENSVKKIAIMGKTSSQASQQPSAARLQAIKNAHIDLLQRKDFEKYEQTLITLKGEEGLFPPSTHPTTSCSLTRKGRSSFVCTLS